MVAVCAGMATGALAQVDAARSTEPPARFDGQRVVRVEVRTARDLQTVLALTDDVWTEWIRRSGPVDVMVKPEQFAALTQSGLKFRVIIEDVQARIDAETAEIRARQVADDATWYTSYHTYADNKTYCQALAAAYPALCHRTARCSGYGSPARARRRPAPRASGGAASTRASGSRCP
jgi:hypothetical protein